MKTLQHIPFQPVRKDLAESCFLTQWQALNSESASLLPGILGQSRCSLRNARVAASFISWIGTNAGACFIREAKLRIEDFSYSEPAYLAAWALANRRERSVSSNVRAIEVILSAESLFNHSAESPYVRASKLAISMEDIDVVESLVKWLSTPHGDSFVSACVAEYVAMRAIQRSRSNCIKQI